MYASILDLFSFSSCEFEKRRKKSKSTLNIADRLYCH